MERAEFLQELNRRSAKDLAAFFLERSDATAFGSPAEYGQFRERVLAEVGVAQHVAVVGSGNWNFSLNPYKSFRAFHDKSDIDVAVISTSLFHSTWEELRRVHRQIWIQLDMDARSSLLRNGQNVYGGFVCPQWIPGPRSTYRFQYVAMLNRLSNISPGKREVKMLYFKNHDEAIDYYQRGFRHAKSKMI